MWFRLSNTIINLVNWHFAHCFVINIVHLAIMTGSSNYRQIKYSWMDDFFFGIQRRKKEVTGLWMNTVISKLTIILKATRINYDFWFGFFDLFNIFVPFSISLTVCHVCFSFAAKLMLCFPSFGGRFMRKMEKDEEKSKNQKNIEMKTSSTNYVLLVLILMVFLVRFKIIISNSKISLF